jgi:hypothetical protein
VVEEEEEEEKKKKKKTATPILKQSFMDPNINLKENLN